MTLITRDSFPGETFPLVVCCRNIANAQRDEDHNPLVGRLDQLIEDLNTFEMLGGRRLPDIFVALEAGRPSRGQSWTEMALKIEKGTGLRYEHVSRLNATPNAFGKALFINPERVAIQQVRQLWTSDTDASVWGGDYYGNSILHVVAHPVVNGRVIIDKPQTMAFVSFPMKHDERIRVARWIQKWSSIADLWMGVFNTFSDDGSAEEICGVIEQSKLEEIFPSTTEELLTFRAFDHDLTKIGYDDLSKVPFWSEVVTKTPDEDGNVQVRFKSHLDRVFAKQGSLCQAFPGQMTSASDHIAMYARILA